MSKKQPIIELMSTEDRAKLSLYIRYNQLIELYKIKIFLLIFLPGIIGALIIGLFGSFIPIMAIFTSMLYFGFLSTIFVIILERDRKKIDQHKKDLFGETDLWEYIEGIKYV